MFEKMITRQEYLHLENPPVCLNVENIPNTEILQRFPYELRHMIKELLLDPKIGNCARDIQITSIYNFQQDDKDKKYYGDSFTLRIPFAGQSLYWEIMFCHRDLLMAPDVMFNDDSFLCGPQLLNNIKANIPSVSSWNPYDSTALVNLTREYFTLYKKHTIDKLSREEIYSRYMFEYTSLVGETGVDKDEVEVLLESNGVVHFLINIPVDFSALPVSVLDHEVEPMNASNNVATLLVTFHRLDGSKIQSYLHMSPHVEQLLGYTGNKCIPPFNAQGCLMDYVPEVKKMLTDRVEAIITNHRMKNEYITYLLTMHSCSVIEYDTLFSKITLLFEHKNFYWLLIINLGNKFPQEKPKIILRSVYHMINGKPYMDQIVDYPYSPRWNSDQMVQRALTHMFENILTFKTTSVQKCHNI